MAICPMAHQQIFIMILCTFIGQFDLICFPAEAPKNNHRMHVATERLLHQPIGF